MTPDLKELRTLDRTIHEPARLMIMTVLYAVTEADFLYLQRECGLTQGNLSSHLSKLEDAKYVLIEKTFKGKYPLTICSLTRKGRQVFEEYLRKIRTVSDAAGKAEHKTKRRSAGNDLSHQFITSDKKRGSSCPDDRVRKYLPDTRLRSRD